MNTKNATWTQLTASTTRDAAGLLVSVQKPNTAATDFCIDVAIGAGGSEIIILADIIISAGTGTPGRCGQFYAPIPIPAGTRISARQATNTASATVNVTLTLLADLPGNVEPYARCITYGARLTGGQSVDAGAVAQTKDVEAIIIGIGNQARNVRTTSASFLMDIQYAYAGGSVSVIPDYGLDCDTSIDLIQPCFTQLVNAHVPSGGTINVRAACSTTTADSRVFDALAYCFG